MSDRYEECGKEFIRWVFKTLNQALIEEGYPKKPDDNIDYDDLPEITAILRRHFPPADDKRIKKIADKSVYNYLMGPCHPQIIEAGRKIEKFSRGLVKMVEQALRELRGGSR